MLALALTALLAADGVTPAPAPGADVERMLTTQAEAWNKGDLVAFCAVYVDDAVFVTPKGVTRGRQQVLERYQKRYPDKAAMGTLSFAFVDTRVDGPAASVVAQWTLSYPGKPAVSGHTLLDLRLRDGKWMIVHDASM